MDDDTFTTFKNTIHDMISDEESIVVNLKQYLIDITTEYYKCIVIFKIIIENLTKEYNISDKEKIDNLVKRINNYIHEIKFSNVSEDNFKVYSILLTAISEELNIDRSILYDLFFKHVQDENIYDEITKRVKVLMGLGEIKKIVKPRQQQNIIQKTYGAKLVAKPGQELTKLEIVNNLGNIEKIPKVVEHQTKMAAIVAKYNMLHYIPISKHTEEEAFKLWSNVMVSSNTKKFIEYYIAYALKLVDPKIKNLELEATLSNQKEPSVTLKTVHKFYEEFFNKNKDKKFELYAIRNRNNKNGYIIDNSKIINILRHYKPITKGKVPEKIIESIEMSRNVDEVTNILGKNDLITTYIKLEPDKINTDNNTIKLTKIRIKEFMQIPIE